MLSWKRSWIFESNDLLSFKKVKYGLALAIILLNSCSLSNKIKTGEQAFDAGQYWLATQFYTTEFKKANSASQKYKFAFAVAESYEKMNDPIQAEKWYADALNFNPSNSLALYRHSLLLKNIGKYRQAYTILDSLALQMHDPNRFRVLMTSLKNSAQWLSDSASNPYKIVKTNLNTSASDYWIALDSTGTYYFTSDRFGSGEDIYKWTGRGFSQIFTCDSNGSNPKRLESRWNQMGINTGLLSFSRDNKHVTFCKCTGEADSDAKCKIFVQSKSNDQWSDAIEPDFVTDSLNYLSPVFDSKESMLYFTMSDPNGINGFDVYASNYVNGTFQTPYRLPNVINSEFNEKYITMDEDTLYVASDNPNGMGGLDIYKTYKESGKWTPMINMKSPVNSPFDDFGFLVVTDSIKQLNYQQSGFLTSNRPGGLGNDDIYRFIKYCPKAAEKLDSNSSGKDKQFQLNLTVYVYSVQPNSDQRDPISGARIVVEPSISADSVWQTNTFGLVKKQISFDKQFKLMVSANGFLNSSSIIYLDSIQIDSSRKIQELSVIIYLHPVIYDVEFTINDIYYDYDKSEIRKDAEKPLNDLVRLLEDNPGIRVQIASHTDCRGTASYNMNLSTRRAASVVNYLIEKGISPRRLTSKGYGESRPVANCKCIDCTEIQHQQNRRTTFRLLK